MIFVFQAKARRSSSYSKSSRDCMEGLLSRVASLGKLFKRKRSTFSEPFQMEPMDFPVLDIPRFYGSTEPAWTGRNLSVIEDVCYEVQSPDEAALVHAAKAYGVTLKERTPDHVTVQLPQGTLLKFDVLDILAFDSTRRRMSIIVRHPETNEIVMYTKGADSGIMGRLQNSFEGRIQRQVLPAIFIQYMVHKETKTTLLFLSLLPLDKSHLKSESRNIACKIQKDLDTYACDGLRTLCITRKVKYAIISFVLQIEKGR